MSSLCTSALAMTVAVSGSVTMRTIDSDIARLEIPATFTRCDVFGDTNDECVANKQRITSYDGLISYNTRTLAWHGVLDEDNKYTCDISVTKLHNDDNLDVEIATDLVIYSLYDWALEPRSSWKKDNNGIKCEKSVKLEEFVIDGRFTFVDTRHYIHLVENGKDFHILEISIAESAITNGYENFDNLIYETWIPK